MMFTNIVLFVMRRGVDNMKKQGKKEAHINFTKYRRKHLIKKKLNSKMKFRLALVYWALAVALGLALRHFVPLHF